MRLALLAACVCLWVSPVLAQTPVPADTGATYTILADPDLPDLAIGYRFKDNGTVIAERTSADLVAGVIGAAWVATTGSHALTVTAWNLTGEAASAPLLVMASPPPPPVPTLGPCADYTTPAGVLTPHAIGDVIQGWNQFDLTTVVGMNRYTARIQLLARWGLAVVIDEAPRLIAGLQYVHVVATCEGVVSLPPPPARQTIPPQASITDATAGVWTLAGMDIRRNGASTGGVGIGVVFVDGKIYANGGDGKWWVWTGTASTPSGVNAWVLYGTTAP